MNDVEKKSLKIRNPFSLRWEAVDPNVPRDATNAPALQLAALHGQMTSVKLLLEAEAEVDKADHEGKSP